ncbi:cation diffusion facilitator family transporter [Defluviimonas sp. WL0002]|uniref:Cation diffusion facilitator family transporter n=1 Tax=Albidovulum marisflavi TaxID=2984159 RepID=A0ABT2ZDZ6_9RHOB|nr:cation diffusion facilitator family transporter [Defluviimonas sp. WL0002]MCV2869363.1 cation diffusion facilitator family transporter [Defluviimonas sp. WL0002]
MPHDHAHGHRHHRQGDDGKGDWQVAAAVAVNLFLTVAQIVGGIVAGSVALIADAIHNFSDALALIIAFAARRIARLPANPDMSFGYGRAEVIAALVNYTVLIVICLWLGYSAVERLIDPPPVQGMIVMLLAGVALVVDLATAALTYGPSRDSMNIRAAFLHNLSDAGTSVAVIVSGFLVLWYDWRLADPLITLVISVWILWQSLAEIGPAIRILMLGAPSDLDPQEIRKRIVGIEGVAGMHHLHLWQIDEERNSLEAHLVLAEGQEPPVVLRRVKAMLEDDFGLKHTTFEVERSGDTCAGGSC